jgi:hypothetical protein
LAFPFACGAFVIVIPITICEALPECHYSTNPH